MIPLNGIGVTEKQALRLIFSFGTPSDTLCSCVKLVHISIADNSLSMPHQS